MSAIEFGAMDYWRMAVIQGTIMTPLVAVMVVSFRVHRGIDVFAAIVSAVAACALAEKVVDSVDWFLQELQVKSESPTKKPKQA
ncbi:MAG: hypothetical protein Q8P67_18085 [archaeon]|nr:hypothetical protein [archaeon]